MGTYLRISYHTAGKTIPLFNLLLRYKIFLNYFMAFGILAILRHHREIINISWWHVISWCTAFYFLHTTGYFLRTTGKRDTSSPSNNKFQACKAKENISAKLRQNIGQESLLIAALSTLFKPRVFDLILEQIQSSCMFHLWYTHFLCQSMNLRANCLPLTSRKVNASCQICPPSLVVYLFQYSRQSFEVAPIVFFLKDRTVSVINHGVTRKCCLMLN